MAADPEKEEGRRILLKIEGGMYHPRNILVVLW
jgi:hypothetical protein